MLYLAEIPCDCPAAGAIHSQTVLPTFALVTCECGKLIHIPLLQFYVLHGDRKISITRVARIKI